MEFETGNMERSKNSASPCEEKPCVCVFMKKWIQTVLCSLMSASLLLPTMPVHAVAPSDIPVQPAGTDLFTETDENEDDVLIAPYKVLGEDERSVVTDTTKFPYSAICKLLITYEKNGLWYKEVGTGFLISENQVLTAGHCLYNRKLQTIARSIEVTPGANKGQAPYGTFTVTTDQLVVNPDYLQSGRSEDDFGFIQLDSPVGRKTKYFSFADTSNLSENEIFTLCGYPYESTASGYPSENEMVQKYGTGSLAHALNTPDNVLQHDIDSAPGQSGSPIFNSKYEVAAIHTIAYNNYDLNGAVLIDNKVKSFLSEYTRTPQTDNAVYRLYNPNSGEHFYTPNYAELIADTKAGWNDEGIAWYTETESTGIPMYRLYNPNSGLHHYTLSEGERNALVKLGWNNEGIAWYTSPNKSDPEVYRLYNQNDGNHHYTVSSYERDSLIAAGWDDEGVAFQTRMQ